MKKDTKWLKEEVMNLYPSYSEMYEHPDYLTLEKVNLVNNFIEIIDQLDEPEQTDTNVGLSKVVIPQFVADWIERCKEAKHNLYGVLDFAPTKVDQWIFHTHKKSERVDLVARAWLDGYEVEKEKLYRVRAGNRLYGSILMVR